MLDRMLDLFPAHTHPLTLVADPDGLLVGEDLLAALVERGFTVVDERERAAEDPDPLRLRHRVEQARPWSAGRPLVVATGGPLERLPYDLWQGGRHITLALHTLFPNVAYPVLQTLSPGHRWKLGRRAPPERPLSRQASVEYLLRHVFDIDFWAVEQPSGLITWLNGYHQQSDPMPPLLAESLLRRLGAIPAYVGWPLEGMVESRETFVAFLREQWRGYLERETAELLGEQRVHYLMAFETDPLLQDSLAGLVRTGALEPVRVAELARLPSWTRSAVVAEGEDRAKRRAAELLALLRESLAASPEQARWPVWQTIARVWAELHLLLHAPEARPEDATREEASRLQEKLDTALLAWLRGHYAALGGRRLPEPHHLYHVPHYLAYRRRQGRTDRVALLILDGMALADWELIGRAWSARHPGWCFEERLLLAQIPTITAVSRRALVSGRRPADFAATMGQSGTEAREWADFWKTEELSPAACPYLLLTPPEPGECRADPKVRACCLVYGGLDDLLHGATLGAAEVQASLRLWLDRESRWLETVVDGLLDQGFAIYAASDHGHVEARGMGRPFEGLAVQTRSKRARLYDQRGRASSMRQLFPRTELWGNDGLLPDDLWVLVPGGREAFAPYGETVVTHGGLSLEEMVVAVGCDNQGREVRAAVPGRSWPAGTPATTCMLAAQRNPSIRIWQWGRRLKDSTAICGCRGWMPRQDWQRTVRARPSFEIG